MLQYSIAILVLLLTVGYLEGQDLNGCTNYFRNVHRRGANVVGRLELPIDDLYPKYKLRIAFSSPIHHMTFRQLRAKDSGSHREFIVDPMEMQRDGKLQLDVFIRLHRMLGPMSRMTRIVYNNVALCGSPVNETEFDDSVAIQLTTLPTSSRRPLPILVPTNDTHKEKTKDYEEEEDIF